MEEFHISINKYCQHLSKKYTIISTSGGCERYVFSREGRIFCHEVFFRMYLPLALEVHNRLIIDSLGFMVVDKIRKHLLGVTQLNILTVALILPEGEGSGEYI